MKCRRFFGQGARALFSALVLVGVGVVPAFAGPDSTPPSVPAGVSAIVTGCARVDLSWTASTDPTGPQSGVIGYRIYRNGSLIATNDPSVLIFSDPALVVSVNYSYRVSAFDRGNNESAQSTASSVTACADATAPSVPATLTATVQAHNQVSLSWALAADPAGKIYEQVSGVKSYELFRNSVKIGEVQHPNSSFTDSTAAGNSTYTYSVRTIDNNNNPSAPRSSSSVTTPFGPPDSPSGLQGAAQSCQLIQLSWNPPVSVGSGLAYYNVFRDGVFLTQTFVNNLNDPSVAAATAYSYSVTAVDTSGRQSAPTAGFLVVTPGCPAVPASNLRIELGDGLAKLRWDGTPGALYQVQCSLGFLGPWVPVDAPTASFGLTNLALQPSSIYRVALFTNTPAFLANQAVNAADHDAPPTPNNLAITVVSETEAALSWDPVIDLGTTDGFGQTFTSGLDRYLVFRDGVFLKNEPAQATGSSDRTVLAETQYSYSVAAIDRAGNRSGMITNSILMRKTCNFQLGSSSADFSALGGNGNVTLTTANGCGWSSVPAVNWVHSTSSGNGNGNASFSVDANLSPSPRSGTLYVGGKPFTVNQAGVSCSYGLNPPGMSHPATDSGGSFSVSAPVGCGWTAQTPESWIHTSNTGNGDGTVNYTVDANPVMAARYGTIYVGGQAFAISQAAASPLMTISEAVDNSALVWTTGGDANWAGQTNVSFAGGDAVQSGTVNNGQASWVETTVAGPINLSFAWKVSSEVGWDVLKFSIDGVEKTNISGEINWEQRSFSIPAGNHSVRWSYSKDPTCCANGSDRGYLDQVQLTTGGCTYSISSSGISMDASGGPGSFTVTTENHCNWNASSLQNWIHTSSSGTGNGSVSFTVDGNASAVGRTGTINVDSQSFTINQAANAAPIANAGADLTLSIGANASFGSNGSEDPDGTIAYFQWDFGDGTTAFGASVSHTYSTLGIYQVRLTAVDNLGASGSDTLLVTVLALPDIIPPNVSLGVPSAPNVSGTIGLNATANDNVSVARVEFYRDGNLFATSTTPPYQTSFDTRSLGNGSHMFMAKAYDGANNSDTSSVSVLVDNTAPTTALTAPANGSTLSNTITLTATASDNSGGSGVARVEFYVDTTLVGSKTTSPYQVSYDTRGSANGSHNLTAKAFDAAGNATASAAVVVSFNNGSMPSNPGQVVWVATPSTTVNDYAKAVGSDASGNVILVGDLNGGLFVHKYSASGSLLWAKQYGSSYGNSVAVDTNGNILVTGHFMGGIDLGGGWLSGFGAYNTMFVVKYGPDGSHVWSKAFASNGDSTGSSVAVDANGNALLTGQFGGSIDFGGNQHTSLSGSSVFLLKLAAANGAHQMSKVFGDLGGGQNAGYGIAVDGAGNILITGTFLGSINFGGGALVSLGFDAFVAKFNAAGSHVWSRRFGGDSVDYGYSIAVGLNNDIILGGSFRGTVDFGAGPLVNTGGYNDGFLAKFNSNGTCQWSKPYAGGAGANDYIKGVSVDRNGNILVTGLITGAFDFGNGSQSGNYNDAFIAKYDANGVVSWGKILGDFSIDQGLAVTADAAGNVFAAGSWYGTVDFGVERKTSIGGGDSYLIRIAP